MNAVHLGAQLPMLLRGAFYENWKPSGTPTHERHVEGFLSHIVANLPPNSRVSADMAARCNGQLSGRWRSRQGHAIAAV
jgi:uncharacterized protein (DUF2267 family)